MTKQMQKALLVQSILEEQIVDLASRLISIPSRNPPGEERQCAEFIHQTLCDWEIESELIYQPYRNRPQLVARLRGSRGGRTVILNGHMDTVRLGEDEQWEFSPFKAQLKDGRLYGLGACDMKGSLAVAMLILKAIKESGADFKGTLMFHAAVGEEMAEDGTKTLLLLGYRGDYAIVLEPTNLGIAPAARGVVWHKITARGSKIHCGLMRQEENDLLQAVTELNTLFKRYHTRIAAKKHALLESPACRVTQIKGGDTHNSTACNCEIVVDRRMLPPETFAQVRAELQAILSKISRQNPSFDFQIEYLRGNEPCEIALDSPLVGVLKHNVQTIGGIEPQICATPFGSDMRNFITEARIPTVNFGAGDFRVCHKPNEYVSVADLSCSARIVMGTVVDLLNNPQKEEPGVARAVS